MDDEKLKRQIGANIAAHRKNAGLTQMGLAEKLNYSDKAVSKWERGESVPDVITMVQLAEQFGIREQDYKVNEDYLWANYVDPSFLPIIAGIMFIIILAGIITIYSIYYISMGDGFRNFEKSKPSVQPPGSFETLFCWKASWLQALQYPLDFWWGQFWQNLCSLECFSSYRFSLLASSNKDSR